MIFKFEERYRRDMPQTIGEADSNFDRANYLEWLEAQLEKREYTILELNDAGYCDCGCCEVPGAVWKAVEELTAEYGA